MIEFASLYITSVTYEMGAIMHQCNCTKIGSAKGVAAKIFKRFPYSDIYKNRRAADVPGSVEVRYPLAEKDGPVVINLLSQFNPGKPRSGYDTAAERIYWLIMALNKATDRYASSPIHFPFGMGCNLAGGNWNEVIKIIEKHAEKARRRFICCREPE